MDAKIKHGSIKLVAWGLYETTSCFNYRGLVVATTFYLYIQVGTYIAFSTISLCSGTLSILVEHHP
jgi:hypothetical protein